MDTTRSSSAASAPSTLDLGGRIHFWQQAEERRAMLLCLLASTSGISPLQPTDVDNTIVRTPNTKKKPLFFFSHISNVGGRSFLQDARHILKLSHCGPQSMGGKRNLATWHEALATKAVPLFRAGLCHFFSCEGSRSELLDVIKPALAKADKVVELVLLREPTTHMASMYTHCQMGKGMRRHGYVPISFEDWLRADDETAKHSCAYEREDFQVRMLGGSLQETTPTGATLQRAREIVKNAQFVGVLEHYGLSLCLLHVKLLELPVACECSEVSGNWSTPSNSSRTQHQTENEALQLTGGDLNTIRSLTARDQVLYSEGVLRFHAEVHSHGLDCWLDQPDATQLLLQRLSLRTTSLEKDQSEDSEGIEE